MPIFEVYQQKHIKNPSDTTQSNIIESLFSRLLDILLFTSAIIITTYTYFTGNLPNTTPLVDAPPSSPPVLYKHMITYKLEEEELLKSKRTKLWTQEQKLSSRKRHSSASLMNHRSQLPRNKKRTQSLSYFPTSKQEDMFSRMEERLQYLIQQGEAALLTP